MTERKLQMGLCIGLLLLCPMGLAGTDEGQSRQAGWESQAGGRSAQDAGGGSAVVAYDFDDDGTFDVIEYISTSDVERLRAQTRQRRMQDARQASMQDPGRITRQRLSGRIHDFFTTSVMGDRKPHVLAQIDTRRGMLTVDLGPTDQVPPLDQGEFIRVSGHWSRVNDRPAFVVNRLHTDRYTLRIQRDTDSQDINRIRGEVLATYTVTADRSGKQLRIARVRLDDGQIYPVNLGPRSQTADLDIEQGDRLTALAQPTQIEGVRGFRAYQVSTNGRTASIDWSRLGQARASRTFQEVGFPSDR